MNDRDFAAAHDRYLEPPDDDERPFAEDEDRAFEEARQQRLDDESETDRLRSALTQVREDLAKAQAESIRLRDWLTEEREAALKARLSEPVARVAGYYGGRASIEYLNHRLVLPVGTALYLSPQKAQAQEPVAKLHITETDDWPDIKVEVLDGEFLQPSMSPVSVFVTPQQAQEPVAEVDMNAPGLINWFSVPKSGTKLYTAPQSAEVDQLKAALALAREKFDQIADDDYCGSPVPIAKKALAAIDTVMKEAHRE